LQQRLLFIETESKTGTYIYLSYFTDYNLRYNFKSYLTQDFIAIFLTIENFKNIYRKNM